MRPATPRFRLICDWRVIFGLAEQTPVVVFGSVARPLGGSPQPRPPPIAGGGRGSRQARKLYGPQTLV